MHGRRGRRSSFVGEVPTRDGAPATWDWTAHAASRTRSLSQQNAADLSEAEEEEQFRDWINGQLRAGYGTKGTVVDIFSDLRDGTVLARLLKYLERRKFLKYADCKKFPWGEIVEKPRLTFHVKQNLTQCFEFIKTYSDIRVFNVGIDDFQRGDRKAVMAVLWALVTFVAKVDAYLQSQFSDDDDDAPAESLAIVDPDDTPSMPPRKSSGLLKLKQRMAEWDARLSAIHAGLEALQQAIDDARESLGDDCPVFELHIDSRATITDSVLRGNLTKMLDVCHSCFDATKVSEEQLSAFFAHAPAIPLQTIDKFFDVKVAEVAEFVSKRARELAAAREAELQKRREEEEAAAARRRAIAEAEAARRKAEEEAEAARRKAEEEAEAARRKEEAEAEAARKRAADKAAALRRQAEEAAAERKRKRLEEAAFQRRVRTEVLKQQQLARSKLVTSSTQTPPLPKPPPPKPSISRQQVEDAVSSAGAPLQDALTALQKQMALALDLVQAVTETQQQASRERAALAEQTALAVKLATQSLEQQKKATGDWALNQRAARGETRRQRTALVEELAKQRELREQDMAAQKDREVRAQARAEAEAAREEARIAEASAQSSAAISALTAKLDQHRESIVEDVAARLLTTFENSFGPHETLVEKSHSMLIGGMERLRADVDALGKRIEAVEDGVGQHGSAVADAALAAGEAAAAAALVAQDHGSRGMVSAVAHGVPSSLVAPREFSSGQLTGLGTNSASSPPQVIATVGDASALRVALAEAVSLWDSMRIEIDATGVSDSIEFDDQFKDLKDQICKCREAYLREALVPAVDDHFSPESVPSNTISLQYLLHRIKVALQSWTSIGASTISAINNLDSEYSTSAGDAPEDDPTPSSGALWSAHVLPLIAKALATLPEVLPEYWHDFVSSRGWWPKLAPVIVSAFVAVPLGAVPAWVVALLLERGEPWIHGPVRAHVINVMKSGYFAGDDSDSMESGRPGIVKVRRPQPPIWVDDILCPRGIQVGTLSLESLMRAGWNVHYLEPYSHATTRENVTPTQGRYMLVGAVAGGVDSKSSKLLVAAAGRRDVVTSRTTSATEANEHHGTCWYFYTGGSSSFGFSPTPTVKLCPGDRSVSSCIVAFALTALHDMLRFYSVARIPTRRSA